MLKDPEVPSKENITVKVGASFRIKGCQIQSTFKKGLSPYWTKNGEFFATGKLIPPNGTSDVLIFEDLVFDMLTPENNGSYKCGILPGLQQLSSPVDIQIEGKTSQAIHLFKLFQTSAA